MITQQKLKLYKHLIKWVMIVYINGAFYLNVHNHPLPNLLFVRCLHRKIVSSFKNDEAEKTAEAGD